MALETAVLTTGLPEPARERAIEAIEGAVTAAGAIPAWIGVVEGRVEIGLDRPALLRLAAIGAKLAARDVPVAVARGESGGTTVSATIALARRAGVEVAATGGIGGVHRGGVDVSADLAELARTPIVLVCSGAKAILDLAATLEALEALSVPVVGYGTDEFPAFWTRESGLALRHVVEGPAEVAAIRRATRSTGPPGALLVCVPPPAEAALSRDESEIAIEGALADLDEAGVEGADVTPFLLERVADRTAGNSLEANLALLEENARVAGEIAVAIAEEAGQAGRS